MKRSDYETNNRHTNNINNTRHTWTFVLDIGHKEVS